MFAVTPAVKVKAGSGPDAFIDSRSIQCNGEQLHFVCANKAERKFERILLNGAPYDRRVESRPLAKTTIIETIGKLKDDLVWKAIDVEPPTVRQNRHYSKHAAMKMLAAEDTCEDIQLPDIQGVVGITMKVIKTKPGTALWIEATPTVFKYLADVVAAERAANATHRKHGRNACSDVELPKGASTTKKGHIRARKRTAEGAIVNKYVNMESSVSDAVATASEFLSTDAADAKNESDAIIENETSESADDEGNVA